MPVPASRKSSWMAEALAVAVVVALLFWWPTVRASVLLFRLVPDAAVVELFLLVVVEAVAVLDDFLWPTLVPAVPLVEVDALAVCASCCWPPRRSNAATR